MFVREVQKPCSSLHLPILWSLVRGDEFDGDFLSAWRSATHTPELYRKVLTHAGCRGQLKCDGTRAVTRFRLSAKRTSPFKSARGASVQSTTGSRSVRISGSNAGYTMFRGSAKSTGYPLHSPVSPLLPHPCVIAYHYISAGVYLNFPRVWSSGRAVCEWDEVLE